MAWQKIIKKQLPLLIFFVCVLLVRTIYGFKVVSFSQDLARDVVLMRQYSKQGMIFIPYGAKTSAGNFFVPPFHYQLHYLLAGLFNHSPLVMHWFTIVVESMTPVVLVIFLSKIISRKNAYLVSTVYAVSPTIVSHGTSAWNPGMIPFFTSLGILCLFNHLNHKSKWHIVLAVTLLGLSFHLHYQVAVLIPFMGLVFLWSISRDKKNLFYWVMGGLINLIFLMPYLVAEYQSGWLNTQRIIIFLTQEHAKYFDQISSLNFVAEYIPRFFGKMIAGEQVFTLLLGRVLVYVGLVILIINTLKKDRYQKWLLIYILSVLAMLRVYKGDKVEYYLSALFIFPFIMLGLLAQKWPRFFIPVIMITMFLHGKYYGSLQPYNQLKDLRQVVETISQSAAGVGSDSVGLFIHDMNLANVIIGGLDSFSELQLQNDSHLIIDVCGKWQNCEWNGLRTCQHDQAYTYSALFKSESGYRYINKVVTPDYTMVMGSLDQTIYPSNYLTSDNKKSQGSDLLSTQLINYLDDR